LDPDPTFGRYRATLPVAVLPRTTIPASGFGDTPGVQIWLNSPFGTDEFYFGVGGPNTGYDLHAAFPVGTLQSDALPLTLPLNMALLPARWIVYDFGPGLGGTINSYSSVEVPEPHVFAILLAALLRRVGRKVDSDDDLGRKSHQLVKFVTWGTTPRYSFHPQPPQRNHQTREKGWTKLGIVAA
jgi:hypothetical protein